MSMSINLEINPNIEFLKHSYIAPLTKLTPATSKINGYFDGGVYYSNGIVCEHGLQIKGSYKNSPAPIQYGSDLNYMHGKCLFGGMLQNEHFGHFLIESLSRIWATQYLSHEFDSIVFYPRIPSLPIPSFVIQLFDLLEIEAKVKIVTSITKFDLLAVPTQIVDRCSGVIYGHPVVRSLFSKLSKISSGGPKKIYISRSHLKANDGAILLEKIIEENLKNEGYEIVYPEKISIREQLDIYNSADILIFSDGSALHLYALISKPYQKVFIVWRKKMNGIFDWQIQSFGGPKIEGLPCVVKIYTSKEDAEKQMVSAKAVIDFSNLKSQLILGGFIAGHNWINPSEKDFLSELAEMQDKINNPLIEFSLN